MSILVKQFAMHQLNYAEQGQLELNCATQAQVANHANSQLTADLHSMYAAKPGKGVGVFDDEQPEFAEQLKKWLADNDEFHQFTLFASQRLLTEMLNDNLQEAGFIAFVHYEYLATDYLLIALLNTKTHVAVGQDLCINFNTHLDIAKCQLAVRIDLTNYRSAPEEKRYLSFIKGRMGRKVADFFSRFIGCQETLDNKVQNKQLVQQVDAYFAEQQLDINEKHQGREQVASYLKEKVAESSLVEIPQLSEQLSKLVGDEQQSFYEFTQHQEAPLAPSFEADKTITRSLQKYSGSGKGITLSFDRQLLGQTIHYDAQTDTLVVQGVPPNLKDQLKRNGEG